MAKDPKIINDDDGRGDKVQCRFCEKEGKTRYYHRLDGHLKVHGKKLADYKETFPGAPTISLYAADRAIAPPIEGVAGGVSPTKTSKKQAPKGKARKSPFKFRSGIKLYMRDDLNAYDKKFVPKHDANWQIGATETNKLEAMAVAVYDNENVMDVGPTGCGKTAGVHQFAAALNQPVRKVPLSGDTRVSDFYGKMVVKVDDESGQAETVWEDGIFTDAVRRGHWVILDEMDSCPPAILFGLHSILEQGGSLVLASTGEVIEPHPNFQVFATANTLGRGDETGLYTGTNILNEAFLDRFGVVLLSTYPEAHVEAKILVQKTGIDADKAGKLVKTARLVRDAAENEEVYCTFSTRRLLAWASKTVRFGNHKTALDLTVLNKLGREDRKVVSALAQRVLGSA